MTATMTHIRKSGLSGGPWCDGDLETRVERQWGIKRAPGTLWLRMADADRAAQRKRSNEAYERAYLDALRKALTA